MFPRLGNAPFGVAAAVLTALLMGACAQIPTHTRPMVATFKAEPPPGFVAFCLRTLTECAPTAKEADLQVISQSLTRLAASEIGVHDGPAATSAASGAVNWSALFARSDALEQPTPLAGGAIAEAFTLTPQMWRTVKLINQKVNQGIAPRSDQDNYGVPDFWTMPLVTKDPSGDCEDYVLEKRKQLLAAGLPETALSIAIVTTPEGESHAVLLVATDRGEMVMDSMTPWVLPWTETRYTWRERQIRGAALEWGKIDDAALGLM